MTATFRFDGGGGSSSSNISGGSTVVALNGPPFPYNAATHDSPVQGGTQGGGTQGGAQNSPEAVLQAKQAMGSGWKDAELRKHMDDLEDEIHGLRWMHEQSARYYGRRMKWLTYPLNILPALSGVGSISFQAQEASQQPLLLTIGIISFLILFLNHLVSTSPWPSLYRNHRITAIEYRKVLRNIHREKLKHPRKRIALQDLEEYVVLRKDQLTPMSLDIPPPIEKNYVKAMRGRMVLPDTILPDPTEGSIANDIRTFHHRHGGNGGPGGPGGPNHGGGDGGRPSASTTAARESLWRAVGHARRTEILPFHSFFLQKAESYATEHLRILPCINHSLQDELEKGASAGSQ